jgi:methionine-rich copper-binding protein CopC
MPGLMGINRVLCASAVLVALGGCAGNGNGLDSSGRPLSEGGGAVPLSADFNSLQVNVFTPICSVCHAGASAPLGLRLDAGNSYNLLVGVASGEVPSLQRVRPGDPNNSYIIQKLEGRAAVGAQMPFGGPPLPATTIAYIRQWITNGAPRSTEIMPGTESAFVVTSVAPASGEQLESAPQQLVVGFSSDLNATRVDGGSVRLERVNEDGSDTTVRVTASVRVPASNARAIVVSPATALPAGHYRLVFDGDPGNVLMDLSGRELTVNAPDAGGGLIISDFTVQSGEAR